MKKEFDFNRSIQIAGVGNKSEADLIIKSGANLLGFPLRLPVNKEDLSEENAAKLIKDLNGLITPVLITYLDNAEEVIGFCKYLNVKIVQLHGNIELSELQKLRNTAPDISVIKSLVITGSNTDLLLNNVIHFSPLVNAFITDTFDPETRASGATGKTHNWEISKKLVLASNKPVILAGGLNPENVFEAIIKVKPAGVDVHSGVENDNGKKDLDLSKLFVEEANKAFNKLNM